MGRSQVPRRRLRRRPRGRAGSARAAVLTPDLGQSRLLVGRSQVVRQRVLVPRSQVRILAPQPSLVTDADARSHHPGRRARHAHALGHAETPASAARTAPRRLGRSKPSAALEPEPLVVVTSPEHGGCVRGRRASPCRPTPRGTGDAAAAARARLAGFDGDVLLVTGDAATISGALLGRLLETHRDERRRRDRAFLRAGRAGHRTAASSATATARSRRSSRRATRARTSWSCARSTPRSTCSQRTSSGRRSSGFGRRTRRASST